MSVNQTACRMARYHRMFQWFPDQPDLAPINVCHFNILQNIFQFLLTNTDLWGTPDIKAIFAMGDSIVALYDRHLDVVDLTTNEPGGDAGAPDCEADDPNLLADVSNDSGIAE